MSLRQWLAKACLGISIMISIFNARKMGTRWEIWVYTTAYFTKEAPSDKPSNCQCRHENAGQQNVACSGSKGQTRASLNAAHLEERFEEAYHVLKTCDAVSLGL